MKTIQLTDAESNLLHDALSIHSGGTLREDWPAHKQQLLTDLIDYLNIQTRRDDYASAT